ncbi:matrixin family metalloprotease [Opitutus sp. ER46]|uniref:matrixin family metalloprotease n=1 Tax=Opitutus sp. ER46 TaxID=2161864 RepID=UPI001304E23E|nr:matrixin family metalloprotease [Opitutus sp. ER46]
MRLRLIFLAATLFAAVPALPAYTLNSSKWPAGTVPMQLQLGPTPLALADGNASWDASAEDALATWNRLITGMQFAAIRGSTAVQAQGNRINNVFFSDTVYGEAWGTGVLAVTLTYTSSRGQTVETDVIFNRNLKWDSYRGATRYSGGTTFDFHRVALHEFGHALGLGHPDQNNQSVTAIMNSRVSNLDALATDDISGAQALYGAAATTPPPPGIIAGGRLVNLSSRGFVGPGGALTAGFVLRGSTQRNILVRGVGPALREYGVTNPLADPQLTVIAQAGSQAVGSNDNWGQTPQLASTFQAIGAFPLASASPDAALQLPLTPTAYTARITPGTSGGSGLALAEVYDLGTSAADGQLVNVSTLGESGRGEQALVVGFTVQGAENVRKKLLVRAVGPFLSAFNVPSPMANPQLAIYRLGESTPFVTNDDWQSSAEMSSAVSVTQAFALTPGSRDAAVLVTLAPGSYTVVITGVGDTTGPVLGEIYDAAP